MQLQELENFPATIPIITQNDFVYPFSIEPIFLYDEHNIKAAKKALDQNDLVFITCLKDDQNQKEQFYDVGVIGVIVRRTSFPDGRVKLLFQGLAKGKILSLENQDPFEALVEVIFYKDFHIEKVQAMSNVLLEKVYTLANLSQYFLPDHLKTIEESSDPNRTIDLIASRLRLKKDQSYALCSSDNIEERMMMLIDFVSEEIKIQNLQKEIKSQVHNKMEQTNREYFLKEQLRQIQKELGVDKQRDEEIEQYKQKLESIKNFLSEDAYKEIQKQINRLNKMHQDSGDANILQNYIEWVLEIPFGKYAKENLSIKNVRKQLELDHYSLKEPKERIVEYFAVRELLALKQKNSKKSNSKKNNKDNEDNKDKKENDAKGTILCFYGPPGVGKTSLANSIAKAIGRELVRIALGGLEDVNELRGHRRTYIGAMPGRITQGLIEAKQMNPVIVLDEIDKVSRGLRGDPTSVLLEILDPEQNVAFRDYYTNFSIDLSQVIFIATANDIAMIPSPLRDRMEFISVSSYTPQEKEQIALKYLIPQELKRHALSEKEIEFSKESVRTLIEKYTREAGVRNLRRVIAKILRKVTTKILENPNFKKIKLTPKMIPEFIDKIVFEIDPTQKKPRIGVVNGLAWTSVGGDLLKIEAIKLSGKGDLALTGSLGDVMKESARIAHSVVKVLIDNQTLKPKKTKNQKPVYSSYDLHLHVPEGATPKDGPSAGIAMACVMASILCDKPIFGDIAMTGELTLSGEVLPIGGLKEKLIAAHKAGVKKVLIPLKNYERDLNEIPQEVLDSIKIIGVSTIYEVLKHALAH